MAGNVTLNTPLSKTTDMPVATTLGPDDLRFVDQANGDGTYTTRAVPFAVDARMSRVPLLEIAASHVVQPGEFGFMVNAGASPGPVVIQLPDLTSWAGAEMLFFNISVASTGAQFAVVASGADAIVSPANGQPGGSLMSGLPGSSFGLRRIISTTGGQSCWFPTRL